MSSRNLGFIDRLRSKSFDKAIITGNNLASYHFIDNFDIVTEEECLKLDTKNKEIYKKNMDLYENIAKQIENKNAMFKIDSPPMPPPEPNNYDRFIYHRLRNVSRNVRYQSFAVNYLINKGYKIIFDINHNKLENEFEPHEAIDMCERLENMTIEQILKREYPNIYTGQNSPNMYNNRKSMNLNLINNYTSNYTPNYYSTYQSSQLSTSAPSASCIPSAPLTVSMPSTPSSNMSFSFPSSNLSASPAPSISYPQLTQPKQHITAPPASHYMQHN
jgi:hypothetical protein